MSLQERRLALQTNGLSPLDAISAKKTSWTGRKAAPEPLQIMRNLLKCRSKYLTILSFFKGRTTHRAPVAITGPLIVGFGILFECEVAFNQGDGVASKMSTGPTYTGEKRRRPVMLRRILTGSLAALLFCVTSWAAACDLSCGFASFHPDCHLSQPEARNSMPADLKMGGAMEDMSMPNLGDGGAKSQQSLSVASLGMVGHAAIDAMGLCERQSCDLAAIAAARWTHPLASGSNLPLKFAGATQPVSGLQALFRASRNKDAAFGIHERSPLSISLRV